MVGGGGRSWLCVVKVRVPEKEWYLEYVSISLYSFECLG
jgi:hypothetical protein